MDEKYVKMLKEYGATPEEVIAWAKEKMPAFIMNEKLIVAKYLSEVKGVDGTTIASALMTPMLEPTATIADLVPNKWETIKAAVVSMISEVTYRGCPVCFKKLDDGERCPIHGEEPVDHSWKRYLIGDEHGGTIVLTVPPKLSKTPIKDKIIVVRGVLNDQLEFFANSIAVVSDLVSTPPKAPEVTSASTLQLAQAQAVAPVQPQPQLAIDVPENIVGDFQRLMGIFKTLEVSMIEKWLENQGLKKEAVNALIQKSGYKRVGNLVTI